MKSELLDTQSDKVAVKNEAYYCCNPLQNGGLSFFANDIIRICCGCAADEYVVAKSTDRIEEIIEKIPEKKIKLIESFKKGIIPQNCKGCFLLKKDNWQEPNMTIRFINMNHFIACNLKCKYCGSFMQDMPNKVKDSNTQNILNVLHSFAQRRIMKAEFSMEIAGGEPSILEGIDDLINFCIENRVHTGLHTNGTVYKESIAKASMVENFYIILTPDAGTREVYNKIKGVDCFDKVWDNIGKYMEATNSSKQLQVKFIIQPDNVDDIENMIEMCVKKKVKTVIVDLDYRFESENAKFYPMVKKFITLCKNNDITVKNGNFLTKETFESLL